MGRTSSAPPDHSLASGIVCGELPSAADAEFLVDMSEVGFHCLDGEMELLGDLSVGSSGLGELGDGGFLGAEFVGFVGAGAPAGSPVACQNSVEALTRCFLVGQAARRYSLISPPRTRWRWIGVSRGITVAGSWVGGC